MFTFGNVRVGGFFIKDGQRYRRVPKAKFYESEVDQMKYFNAVGVKRAGHTTLFFEDDEAVDDIPFRPDRKEAISLDVIFAEMEEAIQDVKENAKACTDEGELELASMYEDDAKDLSNVLKLARDEKWTQAYRAARRMDTSARGYIPREMYDEICDRYMLENR